MPYAKEVVKNGSQWSQTYALKHATGTKTCS